MEDYKDQEDQKKTKKPKLPLWLRPWLGKENQEEPKKPFSERAWEVFQKFLNREAKPPETIEEQASTEERRPFLDFAQLETEQIPTDPVDTPSAPELPKRLERVERKEAKPKQPAEGGELVINHRDEEDESWRSSVENILAFEAPPEVEPPFLPIQQQVELAQQYDNEVETTAASGQPEKLGDLLERRQKQTERDLLREKRRNRQRNRRLKKQVHNLKYEAEDSSKTQETFKKEQVDLQNQVDRLKQQPEVTQLIAHQERERAELKANRGLAARPKIRSVETPKPVVVPERVTVPEAQLRREKTSEQQTEVSRQPAIIKQFERISQEDTRSERDFERRHEIKDEARSPQAASYTALTSADAAYRTAAAQLNQAAASRNYPTPAPNPTSPQPTFQAANLIDSPMYRQAMRNGFLTAIILLAVWFVISLLS